jgi:hypothetical protein
MPRRYVVARRSPAARWTRRLAGIAATVAILAVGYVAISMIVSPDDDEVSASPAETKVDKKERAEDDGVEREDVAAEEKGQQRSGPTRRQRAQRRAAVEEVRGAGYEPVDLADYRPSQTLRVLIGRPHEGMSPGLRAFFFVRGRYIGNDALTPSMKLEVARQRDREITLVYSLFVAGDRPCCPSGGDADVRFRWNGDALTPRETIPLESQRMPAGVG